MEQEKFRYFFDLDGTLAEWQNVSRQELYKKGYFSSLKPVWELIDTIEQLVEGGQDVYILSAVLPDSRFAREEKRKWVHRYIPVIPDRNIVLVDMGTSKSQAVGIHHADVLVDDYSRNLLEWQEAGGHGIKVWNGINGTKGTWTGDGVKLSTASFRCPSGEKSSQRFFEAFCMANKAVRDTAS